MRKKPPLAPVPAAAKKKAVAPVRSSAKKRPAAAAATANKKPAAAAATEKKKPTVKVCAPAKKKPAAKVPASTKKKPAAKVSAADKKKPAAAEPAAAKMKEAAAAMPAATKRASGGTAGERPRKRARDDSCDADLISKLPDDILGTIISLLPTKDGARTQAIARRWRPLWRSAPLNLDINDLCAFDFRYPPRRFQVPRPCIISIFSMLLSDHPGPIRRFDFRLICFYPQTKEITQRIPRTDRQLVTLQSLDNIQELHIFFPLLSLADQTRKLYRMPSSALRFASTLVMATIGYCDFPDEIAPLLSFPLLKHLTLQRVSVSEDIFHAVFSACCVLQALFLQEMDMAYLHISSPTIRSIGFRDCYVGEEELVIDDTPHLERLLCLGLDCETIRVNKAPKLEILGPLSPRNSNIQIGNVVFQGLIPTSLNNSICTVKVLALQFSRTNFDAVLDILRFFPCLEKLYVMRDNYLKAEMKNVRQYDPLDPIKCLQTHLKRLVLKNYKGNEQDACFARFFVLNAEVLNEIICEVKKKIGKKWVAEQQRLLEVETKASPDAELKFVCRRSSHLGDKLDIHDLSIAAIPSTSFLRIWLMLFKKKQVHVTHSIG